MEELLKKHWKRYLVSSGVTFLAGFALAVVPLLDNLTLQSMQDGAIIGVLFVAVRAGLKAVLEAYIGWVAKNTTKK